MRKGLIVLLVSLPVAWITLPLLKVAFLALPLCFNKAPLRLPMPVPNVRPSQVANTFGSPRGEGRRHEGVDIFAPRYSPILSTTNGVVVSVGENRLGGRTVSVIGPGAQRHYFAHLESYGKVRVGQWVHEGYTLGTVGDSGNARGTPPHLHYGIYRFPWKALDPLPLLKRTQVTKLG